MRFFFFIEPAFNLVDYFNYRLLFMLVLLGVPMKSSHAEKSTKERIEVRFLCSIAEPTHFIIFDVPSFQFHKAWLERRAAMKALYYNQLNDSNSNNDRTFLPNYYRRIMKYGNENEGSPNWKELKSINTVDRKHRIKMQKESASRNEVLQSDSEEDAAGLTTTKPIDQLAVESTSTQQIIRTERPISTTTVAIETTSMKPEASSTQRSSTETYRVVTSTRPDVSSANDTSREVKKVMAAENRTADASPKKEMSRSSSERVLTARPAPVQPKAFWSRWQPWTGCSRSCGGGVMSQSRQCLSR